MNPQLRSSYFCDFGKLSFMNEELKDLTVIVKTDQNKWTFCAHKLVFSCASSYFKTLLTDEKVQEISLDEVTPSTAKLLMRYMYCGDLQAESWDEAVELLQAAYKYKMDELVHKCGKFLENVITLSNVCYIYEKASTTLLTTLQHKCLKIILDAGFIVLKSSAFELLGKDCVMDVITSSNLNINTECVVFETLFRWARLECCRKNLEITESNITTIMEPFLQHVCIDDMSDAEKSVLPPSVLAQVEPNNQSRIDFFVPRSLFAYSHSLELEIDYNRFDFVGEKIMCIRFSVSLPTYLIGIDFCVVDRGSPSNIHLTMEKENIPSTIVMDQNFHGSLVSSTQINQTVWNNIKFKCGHPVKLTPLNIYNICISCAFMEIQVPQTKLFNSTLITPGGSLNFTLHAESTWGITSLISI